MSYKRLKKDHHGRQKGDIFLASSRITGDPRRDIMKEAYLQKLIRETKTHDLNDTWSKLDAEAKVSLRKLQQVDKQTGTLNATRAKLEAKLDVIGEIVGILKEIQSTGRTRVGESELKTIVANVIKRKGIDPRALGFKLG